jgi:hypothetical protein
MACTTGWRETSPEVQRGDQRPWPAHKGSEDRKSVMYLVSCIALVAFVVAAVNARARSPIECQRVYTRTYVLGCLGSLPPVSKLGRRKVE